MFNTIFQYETVTQEYNEHRYTNIRLLKDLDYTLKSGQTFEVGVFNLQKGLFTLFDLANTGESYMFRIIPKFECVYITGVVS